MPSEQLVRQWTVLQELAASRRGRSLAELARVCEVSTRTVRRDLEALEAAEFPVERDGNADEVRFRLRLGFALPQVPLNLDESLALHGAALSAPLFENPDFHRPLESAIQKIRAAFPPRVADYLGRVAVAFSHRQPSKSNPETFRTLRILQEQIADRCRVRFAYRGLRGEDTERTVDPYLLRTHGGELYLLAHCHLREEARVFHLERILRACEPLEDEFHLPAEFDAEDHFRQSLGIYLGKPDRAVVRFYGVAARYVESRPLHPKQEAVEQAEGSLTIALPIQGFDEVTYEVLRFAENAEVLEPLELREHVRRVVERLARVYGSDNSDKSDRSDDS